jgi:hypothetical protein
VASDAWGRAVAGAARARGGGGGEGGGRGNNAPSSGGGIAESSVETTTFGSGGVWARSTGADGSTSSTSSTSPAAAAASTVVKPSPSGRLCHTLLKEEEGSVLAAGAMDGAALLSGTSKDMVRTSLFNGTTVSCGPAFGRDTSSSLSGTQDPSSARSQESEPLLDRLVAVPMDEPLLGDVWSASAACMPDSYGDG